MNPNDRDETLINYLKETRISQTLTKIADVHYAKKQFEYCLLILEAAKESIEFEKMDEEEREDLFMMYSKSKIHCCTELQQSSRVADQVHLVEKHIAKKENFDKKSFLSEDSQGDGVSNFSEVDVKFEFQENLSKIQKGEDHVKIEPIEMSPVREFIQILEIPKRSVENIETVVLKEEFKEITLEKSPELSQHDKDLSLVLEMSLKEFNQQEEQRLSIQMEQLKIIDFYKELERQKLIAELNSDIFPPMSGEEFHVQEEADE